MRQYNKAYVFALFQPPALSLAFAVIGLFTPALCRAVPSFARQTNFQCIVCHTEYPILTSVGHQFKMNGYTLSAGDTDILPIAFMAQPSFTHTSQGQPGGAAPRFGDNNNWAVNQVSLFYAGRLLGPYASRLLGSDAAALANKFGVFFQVTYDGIGRSWAWDNAELRYADHGTFAGQDATWGIYLNNNPTLQDPWNSTSAWGFPFSGSALAPTPAAATLIDGGLAQQVGGIGAYALLSQSVYIDVGGYKTLGARFQKSVGLDPKGETQVTGLAPYWRVAYEKPIGDNGRWEIGAYGFSGKTFPGRDSSAGKDTISDVGIDSEYQDSIGRNDMTALVSWTHEQEKWSASNPLELSRNTSDTLRSFKAAVDYLFDKTYGGAIHYFALNGDVDSALYSESATGSPKSDGFIFQLNWLPINKSGGPAFWPKSNIKISLQYTLYNHFNGAKTNYDGAGRNASDNDTTYLEAWIMF